MTERPPVSGKPLGYKAYGSIGHLPNSRLGSGDHCVSEGQARICTVKTRDKRDEVIVQEKVDGCLPYRSSIITDRGPMPIGVIVNQRRGVQILSFNEETETTEFRAVTDFHRLPASKRYVRVQARSQFRGRSILSVVATEDHLIYTDRGWVAAGEVREGDSVFQRCNHIDSEVVPPGVIAATVSLVSTTGVQSWDSPYWAFDLTVDGNANFFCNGVLVHNSCCAVANIDGRLHALGRAGWPAETSRYEQHRLFAGWVLAHEHRFRRVLREGERLVGEWLAQAHGTRYDLRGDWPPFAAFDIMRGHDRLPFAEFRERLGGLFLRPHLLHAGPSALPVDEALRLHSQQRWPGEDTEGVVYRVERDGRVDFLAKWVKPDKVDGRYLPELSGQPAVWNWRPNPPEGIHA